MGRRKTLMLIVTYSCNLRCSYCYEPKVSAARMTLDNAKSYITRIVETLGDEYSEFEVQYMGGEPLLSYSLIHDLSEWLWNTTFSKPLAIIFAATNGTLLTDEMRSWLSANKERICLGLSFDGNVSMQDKNRSQSAKKVDLDYFVKTWPNQSVKMTISPDTLSCLAEGTKYLHNIGFKNISAELAQGEKIDWNNTHLKTLHNQLSKLCKFYVDNPTFIPMSMLQCDISSLSHTSQCSKRCSCGIDMVCVDIDGTEYACHMFSPLSTTREKAKKSKMINFSDSISLNPISCRNCSLQNFCTNCYGMGFSYYDNVSYVSPFICSVTKIKFLNACSLLLQHRNSDDNSKKYISNIISKLILRL